MYVTSSIIHDPQDVPTTRIQGPEGSRLGVVNPGGSAEMSAIVSEGNAIAAARMAAAYLNLLVGFTEHGVVLDEATVSAMDDVRMVAQRLTYAGATP